ncbi:Activin receptor type-2A [Bulinus truncatus]|nr:Activin receptor type-2A [Bulinus truncatus]
MLSIIIYNSPHWNRILAVLALVLVSLCCAKVHKGSARCEKYDCPENGIGPCIPTVEECANMTTGNKVSLDEPHNYMLCFVSWYTVNNSQDKPVILKKGCWMNDEMCYNQKECVEDKFSAAVFFCCCDGDLCNKNFYHRPSDTSDKNSIKASATLEPGFTKQFPEQQLIQAVLYSIVPIIGVFLFVVTGFFIWRRHQRHIGHTQLPTVDPSLAPTPSQSSLNLQLLELKARGRYGSVWKAQLPDQYVAVKIFPLQDKQSWMSEIDIYNLPQMKHENILCFIASERKEDNLTTELWLVTEFHDKGNHIFYYYLK